MPTSLCWLRVIGARKHASPPRKPIPEDSRIIQNIWFLPLSSGSPQCLSPMVRRLRGGTLSAVGRPCLSGASWPALLKLASGLSHEARRGVNGFGSFCRNKRASPAGAKPGFTEHHVDTRSGGTSARRSPGSAFSTGKTQDESPINIVKL